MCIDRSVFSFKNKVYAQWRHQNILCVGGVYVLGEGGIEGEKWIKLQNITQNNWFLLCLLGGVSSQLGWANAPPPLPITNCRDQKIVSPHEEQADN